jgi:carbon storage regulator
MLVLSRRPGESVVIGNDVVVTVLEVRGDVIRLGIRAPRAIQVHREEVFLELQRANQEAAASSDHAEQALRTLLTPPAAAPPAEESPPAASPPAASKPTPGPPTPGPPAASRPTPGPPRPGPPET